MERNFSTSWGISMVLILASPNLPTNTRGFIPFYIPR